MLSPPAKEAWFWPFMLGMSSTPNLTPGYWAFRIEKGYVPCTNIPILPLKNKPNWLVPFSVLAVGATAPLCHSCLKKVRADRRAGLGYNVGVPTGLFSFRILPPWAQTYGSPVKAMHPAH